MQAHTQTVPMAKRPVNLGQLGASWFLFHFLLTYLQAKPFISP